MNVFPLLVVVLLLDSGQTAPVVVVDDGGDTVRLAAPARRVVSLNPATTELLYAIGAGGKVAGRTESCDFPAEARWVPSVGGGFPPNVEAVVARAPDLVLLYHGGINATAAERLRQLGVPVVRLRTDRLDGVPRLTRLLGKLTGQGQAADRVARTFEHELERERAVARQEAAAPIPVLLLAWDQPIIALGRGSFVSELVELAGGRNIFADIPAPSVPVALEAIVARRPRVLVTVGAITGGFERPEWGAVAAARERRSLALSESAYNHPGPRIPAAIRLLRSRLALQR
ncbi:MAG: ABC transporter substrate-binding protein [Gemmatimonadales bacterium]|nr:ABC transporter substrate-binding protein [Gemmatimonadales bacterium]